MAGTVSAGNIEWTVSGNTGPLANALNQSRSMIQNHAQSVARGMAVVGGAITAGLGVAMKRSMDFGKSMAAIASLGVKDLEPLKKSIMDISAEYGLNLVDSANAAYDALSSGADAMNTPRILEAAAKAAVAGQTDLNTSIKLGMQVANAYGLEFEDLDKVFNTTFVGVNKGVFRFEELAGGLGRVGSTAKALNISFEETTAAIAALTLSGLSSDEAITRLAAALNNVLTPSSKAIDLSEKLGLQFNATALQSKGLAGFMDSVKKATGGNVEKMAQLFGSSEALGAMLALTGEQAGAFNDILNQTRTDTGALDAALTAIKENDPGYVWRQLRTEIDALAIVIGDSLGKQLKGIVEDFKGLVQTAGQFAKENPKTVDSMVKWAGGLALVSLAAGPLLKVFELLRRSWLGGVAALKALGFAASAFLFELQAIAIFFTEYARGSLEYLIANEELEISQAELNIKTWDYAASLIEAGYAVDTLAMKEMSQSEQQMYLNNLKAETDEKNLIAFMDSIAQRKVGNEEIVKAHMLATNEYLSMEEYARLALTGITQERIREVAAMDKDQTQAAMEQLGYREKNTAESSQKIENVMSDSMNRTERNVGNSLEQMTAKVDMLKQHAMDSADAFAEWTEEVKRLNFELLKSRGGGTNKATGGIVSRAMGGGVPGYARGGLPGHRIVEVGEAGRELVALPIGSRVMNHAEMKAAASGESQGGGTFTLHVNTGPMIIREEADVQRVSERLYDIIKRKGRAFGLHLASA